jgi:hypothetical protein
LGARCSFPIRWPSSARHPTRSGVAESSRAGIGDPVVAGSLVGGVAALVEFVLLEGRVREPMVPLSLFRVRNFAGAMPARTTWG